MKPDLIHALIVYRKKMALQLFLFSGFCLIFLFISNNYFNNKFFSIFFLVLTISPLFFINFLMAKFKKEIIIHFQNKLFSIVINISDKTYSIHCNEIMSYSIQSPNRRFTSIKLNFKNEKAIEYSFIKDQRLQIPIDMILNQFHAMIQNYNQGISTKDKIVLKPSFFASKRGWLCICALCLSFFIAIYLHILFQVTSLPITLFFGFAIILQIVMRRNSETKIFEKWSNAK